MSAARPDPARRAARARDLLDDARARERAGCIAEALARYEAAIASAEGPEPDGVVLAEALRRLAALRSRGGAAAAARTLCRRSLEVARTLGHEVLAAEALNTLGGIDLTGGSLADARRSFLEALRLGGASREVRARVEQNLGILANIQGQLDEALSRYRASLEAYRAAGDLQGCAIAYHNLAMVSADLERYEQADAHFAEALRLAERVGDAHLRSLCLVNQAEVDVARQRYENARQNAEEALALFDQLGERGPKATAYRVLGMMYRELGLGALAESRLRTAVDLALAAGSALNEAEARRELALLHQGMGRNLEALTELNAAHRLFRRLDARVDLVHVAGKIGELEGTYLAVVREWGRSIEASDRYTFGHCERVASGAVAMARVLGLDDEGEKLVLLGAYLHDVGMVRVPHEILSRPGPLTEAEVGVVRMHPLWGAELLAAVEFPWDLKPIIRWHHEKYDGSGYPDRLKGDEIPLAAQIVGILDVYDALTTPRAYQAPLAGLDAVERIRALRHWWSDAVFEAFLAAVAGPARDGPPPPAA